MELEFRQLETFCRVVEEGTFTRAAHAVHRSQSSVSERIAALEQAVGAPLLERVGRPIVPTPTGRALYEGSLDLLRRRRDLAGRLKKILGVVEGTATLGASTIPGEYILPPLVAEFRHLHPGVLIGVRIADTGAVAADVMAAHLELGVVGSRTKTPHLRHSPLWEDELVMVVPAEHRWAKRRRLGLDELPGEPFLSREPGSGTRKELEAALRKQVRGAFALSIVAELGSTSAIKAGILAGLGVSILSSRAVRAEVDAGLLTTVRLSGIPIRRRFFLIHDGRRTFSPACEQFVRFLKGNARC